jgi:hypothetical protein
MDRKLNAWPALLMLVACQADRETAEAPTARGQEESARPRAAPIAAPTGPPSISSPAELIGEYRIAGVDGASVDLPYGMTASMDERTIRVVADCVNLAWDYNLTGGQLSTERIPVESCARGLNATEQAVVTAFDSADLVRLMPSNGIEFSGDGHSVLLFSQ